MKTKLHSTMSQNRLNGLLNIFIEQEIAYNTNIDEAIDTFKSCIPLNKNMES